MTSIPFGLNPRQLNLTAIRIQELFARGFGSLDEAQVVRLNVAQNDAEILDMRVQPMSAPVLVAYVLELIAANNSALTEQLHDLGLEGQITPELPSTDLDDDE